MEDFLPSNRTIQALESLEGASSLPGSLPQQQVCRVLDILTWIRCFTLYIAVMSQKMPELVPPMTAHLHTVMKLEQSVGDMSWFQYDWKARREMCAAGASTWGRCDPWQLLTCMPSSSEQVDPFDPLPQGLKAEWYHLSNQQKSRQPANQTKSGTTQHRQNGVCRLFNRAPAGCPYGEACIFIHRCTQCRRPDHGKKDCPSGEHNDNSGQ